MSQSPYQPPTPYSQPMNYESFAGFQDPLAPARRKAELLRFARRAARRLSAQIDPSLGDAF